MAGRSKMVACRLSDDEYSQLLSLLDLDEMAIQDCFSEKLRSFIKALDGRLYMDYHGFLKLRLSPGELSEQALEKLEVVAHQSLYDSIR